MEWHGNMFVEFQKNSYKDDIQQSYQAQELRYVKAFLKMIINPYMMSKFDKFEGRVPKKAFGAN